MAENSRLLIGTICLDLGRRNREPPFLGSNRVVAWWVLESAMSSASANASRRSPAWLAVMLAAVLVTGSAPAQTTTQAQTGPDPVIVAHDGAIRQALEGNWVALIGDQAVR